MLMKIIIKNSRNTKIKRVSIRFYYDKINICTTSPAMTIDELIDLQIEISKYIKSHVTTKRY